MSENKTKKYNFLEEFKIFVLIFTAFAGYLYVPKERLIYFAIFSSLLLIVATLYIRDYDLSFSKHLLNIAISLYNIITLFFMVQYFISSNETRVFKTLLYPFYNDGNFNIPLIVWIFILTLFLQILQFKASGPEGDTYGR